MEPPANFDPLIETGGQYGTNSTEAPGSPIGKKGPRKANAKYKRRSCQPWSDKEVKQMRSLAKANTPTGVISLKMGRPLASKASKAQREGILRGLRTALGTIGAKLRRMSDVDAAPISRE
jgi:hypothetical protein